ncbi:MULTISPECIES: tryptophan--tRNA ligase [Peptoniphilus]|uniref:tryptophan--tRNA ligase n=1 Tax=Peptoniphilus TaxID=162289 RepID=UPI00290368BA|nr:MULTISPECIES: tryptophan--tRNA ligase [Peptoniphilus]MDU1042940.1 tryptophan--tRNA ligase [Peptoniphilus rhinitidis]MDU1954386.1 tryptophan--tRNA ligase [Peptoniphilus lacydonensis]MDU5274849.1 tryptophan--tRNA ligase [Peptoniphilus lacydonensis]MDU5594736.1 tryptophan--tRNA ligase [Peptoniphilus rhinitidis]
MNDKKIVYSGIQPSGSLTIGNYIGALKNFIGLQDEYNCLYCIVDMHAITAPQEPKDLRKNTLDVLALYLSAGLDPEKSIIYIQSHVPEHAELGWVLNTMTGLGQLQRMTQFKDKSKKYSDVQAGILNYPVLMAADILLYGTSYVPVGEDQKQHLELTRDLAQRFNSRYSETFVVPEILTPKVGARIMSLKDPSSKMSKSDSNKDSFILILDSEDDTRKKIKRAVTDSSGEFRYSDEQPGLKNLINIHASFSGMSTEEIVKKYENLGYGEFKEDLGEVVVEGLRPLRERFKEIRDDKAYLESVYKEGSEKASYLARKTLRKVYKKVGFIPR